MSFKGKFNAPWNESIGMLKGQSPVSRRDSQSTSLTLNEFLESKFEKTNYKIGFSPAFQVGTKYGIDPGVFSTVKKTADQYIIASTGQVIHGEENQDIFGWSTSLSDDGLTLAVGSILNDGVNGLNSGSVRVFNRTSTEEAWIQKGVDIDGEAAQDYAGWSISLSTDGDRLAIGAVFNDDGLNENTGHVRVYDWNSGTSQWDKVGLDINGTTSGDFFGYSVSMSSDKTRIAVGAPHGFGRRGYVGVYYDDSGTWTKIADVEGVAEKGEFGKCIALKEDGTRLAVAAPKVGVLYYYSVDSQVNLLVSRVGPAPDVLFGHSIDFRGNTLLVADMSSLPLKIYDMSADTFVSQAAPAGIFRSSETKVRLSSDGNTIVLSMPALNTEENVINSTQIKQVTFNRFGVVRIYGRDGENWRQRGWNLTSYARNRDEYGRSISVSGDGSVVCVSAPRKDDRGLDRGCVSAYTVRPISYYVKPKITLLGLNPQPLQANTSYAEVGAVTDTGATVTISGEVENNTIVGQQYSVRYTASSAFATSSVERRVVITKDPTVPILTFIGDAVVKIPVNGVFNDPGVTSNIPATITTNSHVDYQTIGAYDIEYTAFSTYGIKSDTLTRTIYIVYDIELESSEIAGKRTCMSKDGFVAATGDFATNTVVLYEWSPVAPIEWKKIGQTIVGSDGSGFGAALDLSANGLTVVVGAPSFNNLAGVVRVYEYNFLVNAWERKGDDITDSNYGDKMGEFVCISGNGNTVSTGSFSPSGNKNPYVFTYRYSATTDTWTKIHEYTEPFKLPVEVVSNQFSGSLDTVGAKLLLGAPVNNYATGAVFLFDLTTGEKLVSIFGDAVGANLGQSVKLAPDGNTFVFGDVSAGCVKVYGANLATGFWSRLGDSITESYSAGGDFGKFVDISKNGGVVTFSDPSTELGLGKIYQYKWDGENWLPNMVEVNNNVAGSFFGRRLYVTEDASKILTESTVTFQLFRWNIARPSATINGSARLLRLSVDQPYVYNYVTSASNIVVTGQVNTAVTNNYVIKYTVVNDIGLSEVFYQIVSVSGDMLQLGLDIRSFDTSATALNLGWSASMSDDGTLLAVGLPGYENDRGRVKIYQFDLTTIIWELQTTITGPSTGSLFGYAVCLSKNGTKLAIGAPGVTDGLVRVYNKNGATWNQLGSDMTGTSGGKFGFSVSLNLEGTNVVVGEPRKSFDVNTGAGATRMFSYTSSQWTEISSMTNNQLEHELGHSVAVTSTTNVFLSGAPMAGPGYVKLSSYIGGNVPIFAQPLVFGEKFGWAVTITNDGNTFAVGAPYYNNKTGRVLVYDATTTPPSLKGSPILGDTPGSEFGLAVHLTGDGSKLMIHAGGGRVTVSTYNGSAWVTDTNEVITSSELDIKFGNALSSSVNGERLMVSAPLLETGSGLVRVFSTRTSQIQNRDFIGPTLTLNGPVSITHSQGLPFIDPGVRRNDLESGFTTTGTVDINTLGTYTLTYTAQDAAGNPSVNTLSRTVEVVPVNFNNVTGRVTNALTNHNNAGVQMSGDGTRFAVCSGAAPLAHVSQGVAATEVLGTQGNVTVYEIDDSASPSTFTQVGQITDSKRFFATSMQLNQDGTKIAVMSTPDPSSTEISVYGLGNTTYSPLAPPFPRTDTYGEFNLANSYSSITDITSLGINLFGRTGDRQSYRYKNLAASRDGSVIAIGKPMSGIDAVSLYKRSGETVTIGSLTSQAQVGSHTGLTATDSDISSNGERIIFCDDETTFIYNTTGNVQEAAFTSTEKVNALSDNGLIAAVATKKIVEYTPITLTGGDRVSVAFGSSWSDPGFVYTGSDAVTVTGTVTTSQQGEYIIQYTTGKNVQIRIVNVEAPTDNLITFNASHSTTNIPYGPGFAGWTGTWRTQDFTLFTVPSHYGTISNDSFNMSITLNGTIPVAGNLQYQSIQIFTDNGFSSSIGFTSNGSESGVSYSWSGSVYTNHTRTTSSPPSGFLSGGDVVKGRLHLYNTYYSTFSVDVDVSFGGGVPVTTPTITLIGLSENSIAIGDSFVDPGVTSSDSVSTYISPTFPQSVSCRKAIVYQAVSGAGIIAYAVRYVGVETRPKVFVYNRVQTAWSRLGQEILTTNKDLDIYDTAVCLSELGLKFAISKYTQGQGYIFTYEYDQSSYPPAWVQYGSTIEISGGERNPGFSLAMSGDGNRIVIGSPGNANTSGEVYVYNYDTTNGWVKKNQDLWTLTSSTLTTLGISNYSMDLYGHSVDISKDGAYIIVGAPLNVSGRGHVSVYTLSGTDFVFKGRPLVRDVIEPEFGRQVSITDNGLAFVTNAGASATSAGKLIKYLFENNIWVEFATIATSTVPISGSAISESGNKVLFIKDVVEIHTVGQTQVPGGGWDKLGQDITLSSITAPGADTNPSPSAGSRYSPGIFKPTNSNVTGYTVDLSHNGTVLAIGLPFLEMGGGDPFVVNSRGSVAVFSFDGLLWNQVGGTIVPKYVYDSALTTKYDGATSVTALNEIAEANTFSGADISLSGDGQFICVGSPGYLSNPIDLQSMDSLPNEGGMTFWTLYRRNSTWAPANDLYNVGWEPVVRRDSELSESLVDYDQTTTVNEKKRELLGLGLKVSTDGSFVVFDTRTDGVKILAESSGSWSVQEALETETTTFLKSKGVLIQNMPHESTYTQAPGSTYGKGNFPAKHWPVSYISLSSNDKYLSVSQPLFDPLFRASTTANQQVEDMRMGQVVVYKGNTNTRQKRRDVNIQQFLSDIRQNQGNAEETLNLYEPLTVSMSKDGSTIAIASPYGKLDGNGDPDFIDTATLNAGFTAFRSWIQVYTYSANKWIKKGALIAPQQTGNPGNTLKLTIGQNIALSSNGSRMVVSGIKGENITSPADANDLPDHVHEVYIFDYDSGSATWITTSGDAANMEKIYIDASKRRYRGSTDWIYEDDRFVAGASLHGGTHKDAYQLGSISSVSISDDGTRIAVSTANYSAIDFVAASSVGDVTAGTQKTSQCLEMVLVFEYDSQFHNYSAWETTPPYHAPSNSMTQSEALAVNASNGSLSASNSMFYRVGSGPGGPPSTLNGIRYLSGSTENLFHNHVAGGLASFPNATEVWVKRVDNNTYVAIGRKEPTGYIQPPHGDVIPYGINVFPHEINHQSATNHWGAGIFSTGRNRTGWNTIDADARQFENVYITGGTHANWKLLHWELFKSELDMDGQVKSPFTRFDFDATGAHTVAIDQNGVVLLFATNGGNLSSTAVVRSLYYNKPYGTFTQMGDDINIEENAGEQGDGLRLALDARSGMQLIIAAPKNDGNGADSGNVRMRERYSGGMSWFSPAGGSPGTYGNAGDERGTSIEIIDGSASYPALYATVGSPGHGSNNEGKVEIWKKNIFSWPFSWSHQATIVGNANENIGSVVGLNGSGHYIAVGVPSHNSDQGSVRWYFWNHGAPYDGTQYGNTTVTAGPPVVESTLYGTTGASERFGYVMAHSRLTDATNMRLAITTFPTSASSAHACVRVYTKTGFHVTPTQMGADIPAISNSTTEPLSIAITGYRDRVAIGARHHNNNSGNVRVYQFTAGAWTLIFDVSGTVAGEKFGTSVALNGGDGTRLLVGGGPSSTKVSFFDIGAGGGTGPVTTRHMFWDGTGFKHKGIPHSIVSGLKFIQNDALLIERYDNATGGVTTTREYLKGQTNVNHYEMRNYNTNRYPSLLVFDSSRNLVTNRSTQSNGVAKTDWYGTAMSSTTYPAFGDGVRWTHTYTVPTTTELTRDLNGGMSTRNNGWWINPVTGWMLLDFNIAPGTYEDVPYSVDISSPFNRVVFGIPQAGNHRGKICIFDVSTESHTQNINGVDYSTSRYALTKVGDDIYGNALKGRFGESVSMSADGNRVAVGNRPFYREGTDSTYDDRVQSKFYVYERDVTTNTFNKTIEENLKIISSLENPGVGSRPTLSQFQFMFYDQLDDDVYSKWGRPPCFQMKGIGIGTDNSNQEIQDLQQQVWVDSRYGKVDVTLSATTLLVSFFNGFRLFDIGNLTSKAFSQIGDTIAGQPDTYAWGTDDFAYSYSTLSENGRSVLIPVGNIGPTNYQKELHIYDFDGDVMKWNHRNTSVVDGTSTGGQPTHPVEYNFLSVLSNDRTALSTLYFGPAEPVFRQHLISTTVQQQSYNKISSLVLVSTNINAQQFSDAYTSERIPNFTMSNDGTKIAIGNTRDTAFFSTTSDSREMGSVGIFNYDSVSEEWNSQKISITDSATYVNTGFAPARFGKYLDFVKDGTSLVVSAPSSRDGQGDIFFFDTSSTTTTTQKASPFTNPSGESQNMFGSMVGISDDFTRLFIGDPGHGSGVGRIIVTGYDGSSWGTPQYITRNGSPEGILNTNVKFGQTFDISGDGDYLISSFFGEGSTNTLLDFVSYYNTNSGVDIAEVWQRNKDTNTWGVKSTIPLRLKTGTNISVPQGVTSIPHQLGSSISANLAGNEGFGYCVDCTTLGDGTLRFVASAPYAFDGPDSVGGVLVFDYDAANNTWTQVGQTIYGSQNNGYFGVCVAIAQYTGTRIVIGEEKGANPPGGFVEVWDYDIATTSWQLVGNRITDTQNNSSNDNIGRFVDISGDGSIVITGALGHDHTGWIPRYNKGAVFQYTYNGTSWIRANKNQFHGNTGVGNYWYSERCAISANGQHRVLASVDANTYQGAVGVFRGTATSVSIQYGSIKYGSYSYAYFGSSVTINDDGSRFAAQAPAAGYVSVYEWDGTDYLLMGSNITGFPTHISYYDGRQSISLSGDGSRIAIGAQRHEVTYNGLQYVSGLVKIYDWDGANWNQFGDTIIGGLGEMMGSSVSLTSDGKKLVCGARGVNGLVKVYDLDPLGPHSQLQYLADNENIQPTVKISDGGRYSLYGVAAVPKLVATSGQIARVTNELEILKNLHDTTPVIDLVGGDLINVAVNASSYTDPGVTTDDPSDTVVISGDQLDVDTVGTYVVRYTVTRFGLVNFVERTFNVFVPNDPPTLSLIGNASVSLLIGNSYTEPDPAVTFTGGALETYGVPPDGSVPGTFRVRYVVRNTLGVRSVERVITVEPDTTPPALTILGGNVVHKVNTNYRDPSYVGSDGNEEIFTITPSYILGIETLGKFRGVTSVTYSATDQAGNIGTSVRSVTVKDDFEAASVHTISDSHSSALSSTGNRIASMVGQDVSLNETGGALVNTWTGLGSLVGQMVRLNSDGTIVAFTTVTGVYVYEYTTSWVERSPHSSYPRFKVSGSTAFRIELSDDASTLAVSYPGGTAAFLEEVAVFRWNGSAYTLDYNQGSSEIIGLGDSVSLKSDGTRLALGYPNKDFSGGSSITSTRSTSASPYPTRNGVKQLFGGYYKLTSLGQYGSNNTMYWQLNLGSSWTVSWEWYIYGPRWGGADDMRLIYFAPNQITAYQASTHGGYNNFYEFWQGDTHQIRDNKDVYKKTQNVYYGTRRWLKVDVSYDNGVMTSTVRELYGSQRLVSTLSHDFGNAHESLYGQSLYFGFSGRTGGVSSSQYIRNINLSTNVPDIGEIEVFDRSGPSNWSQVGGDIRGGLQDQKLGSTVKLSGDGSTILNVNKGRDGNQQKVSVYSLNSGTWTKNATLLDSVTRTFGTDDTDDLVDLSDDGSMVVYTKGTGTETYAAHPNGLASKYLDGFKLDGGVYKHALVIPNIPTASTKQVFLAGDKSKVLVQCGTDTSVFDVTQSVFNPVITLTQDDGADPLIVSSYTEQGATSSDGTAVQIGGDSVISTPGNYRVQYSTSTSGFRIRTVKIIA